MNVMSKEEILEKLLEFGEYLTMGTIFDNVLRSIGWAFVLGMAWVIDSLENIADTILGLRVFFENPEVVAFINQMQPLLIILFAFNILFIGYLLIFQKEFNRAGVFSNVFMALVIVVALGSGMHQGNEFIGDAIDAINYEDGDNVSMANHVIQANITDVGMFDQNGWDTPELEERNQIETDYARDININSYLTEGSAITAEKDLTSDGDDILSHKVVTFIDGSRAVERLEDGGWITDISQEYYYRYTVDWINLIGTLGIMALVLVTVSVKLAQLFFELTFNYILAPFVAASDMHSGQRMKQMVQNILNIFLVTIMIFLSLKVYLIGTAFLGETLSGFPYLIAMIGLAIAVMGGPNIVERLFGIDAGGKSGWAVLAGTYAAAKGVSALTLRKGPGKGLGAASGNAMKGNNGKSENVSKAANDKANIQGSNGIAQGQRKEQGQAEGGGKNGNVVKQAQNDNVQKGTGAAAASNTSSKGDKESVPGQRATGGEGQSAGKQSSSAGSSNSLHDEMKNNSKNEEKKSGSSKPTSLHEQMMKKGATGAGKGSVGGVGAAVSSAASGTVGVTNKAARVGESEPSVDQGDQKPDSQETASVNDQKQGTVGSTATKAGSASTVGGAANGATSVGGASQGGKASGNGGTKTATARNSQRAAGQTSQGGKEIIEEQNEVIQDSSGGTVEQETRSTTANRQGSNGGNASVKQGAFGDGGSASPSGGVATGGVTGAPLGGTSGRTSGVSSTSGVYTKTSTVKNTQRQQSTNGVQNSKEIIEEQNEVIQENRTPGQANKEMIIRHSDSTKKQNPKGTYQVGPKSGKIQSDETLKRTLLEKSKR